MKHNLSQHKQIRNVYSFETLVETPFQDNQNAFCWKRKLAGDFEELVSKLHLKESVTEIDTEDLVALELSEKGDIARRIILNDLRLLRNFGASPTLNLIKNYDRDDALDFISTDVYSFHVDHSPIATSTFLCTYYGTASDILPNKEAIQKILIPEVRQKLKELYDGNEAEFEFFLKDNYFDWHYEAQANSQPINLGIGHLWRLAVDHPAQNVLPCIHRAPLENQGEYRLLLIC